MGVSICKPGKCQLLSLFLITSIILLSGCGGGSSGNGPAPLDLSSNGSGQNITIKTLDNPVSQKPLPNVDVILYQQGNVVIAQSTKTDSNGAATLTPGTNNSNNSLVTISMAYQDTTTGKREIKTFIGLTADNYTFYLGADTCQSKGKFNVTVEDSNATNSNNVILEPFGTGKLNPDTSDVAQMQNGTATLSSANACSSSLQSDGKFTPLVLALDNNQLMDYGFLPNQDFIANKTYAITLDKTPDTFSWNSNDPTSNIYFYAQNKGVFYFDLGFWNAESTSNDTTNGSFPVAGQFPADTYGYYATTGSIQNNVKSTQRQFNNFSNTATINFTANQFTDFTFDGANTFSWTLNGNANKDVISISAEFTDSNSTGNPINWTLYIDPSLGSATLPALPADVQTWFTHSNLNPNNTDIQETDVTEINGYMAYVKSLGTTSGFNMQTASGIDEVTRNLNASNNSNTNTNTNNGNTGGNTGGNNNTYGSLAVSGDSANTVSENPLIPFSVCDGSTGNCSSGNSQGITWNTANYSVSVMLLPADPGKAQAVTLGDNFQSSWSVFNSQVGVQGVSISGKSVTFNNVVLTSTNSFGPSGTNTSTITLKGILTY